MYAHARAVTHHAKMSTGARQPDHHHPLHHRRRASATTTSDGRLVDHRRGVRVASRASATGRRESGGGQVATSSSADELSFWGKMRAAYRIFFPPNAEETARQEAKKRLRMILVADRCTMSESSMDEMKMKIMDVVGEFVDVDEEQEVDVSMNTDEELGTMYAVSIPVKRVKAEYDAENDAYMLGAQWDPADYDDNLWEEE